jgi:flagellar hook-length control protein FliK
VKLGGFGAVDAVLGQRNRVDQMKIGATDLASGGMSKTSAKASDQAAGPAVVAPLRPTRSASRLSNSSIETSKDFSTVLDEASDSADAKETKRDSTQESLALSANSVGANQAREQRSKTAPDSREASAVEKSPISGVNSNEGSEKSKASQGARVAAFSEPGSIEEKISEIAETLDETTKTELSMRHISMREFLSKMKEEFGIEPQSVVNAFATLDVGALAAPPEQTASAVLSQLGLKPEQMPKAESFYREMLNQTGESALNETLVGVDAGISLKVLSEQDVAMEKLQKSILGINDAFARRNESFGPSKKAAAVGAAGVAMGLDAVDVTLGEPVTVTTATIPAVTIAPLESAPTETAQLLSAPKFDGEVAEEQGSEKTSKDSKFASIGAALSSAAAGLAAKSASTGDQGSGSKSSRDNSAEPVAKPKAFDSIESALAATGFEISNVGGERAATPLAAGSATSAVLAATLAGQDGEGTSTNAQDLVRHAQMLVKNGGGEMKMQLKPEGVGDVTLKVAVKDGQVQIQMMTETDSAKRVLESNLDDLKTSLAQHKLHVDAVKIEVGGDMAKQRFEQAQQDANREQTRQMAQDFMSQFRNDREGFRQGFGDTSGFRNYQQPRKNPLPEIEPIVASSVSKEKTSGDRRLNLVA